MKFLLSLGFSCVVLAPAGNAQFAFQNLGFESAQLTPIPLGRYGDRVPISDALPGWTGYYGTRTFTYALQNNLTLGSPNISILGPDWTTANGIIEGRNTVLLQAGGVNEGFVDVSLAQTGLVPATARSIVIKIGGTNFDLSLGGRSIPLVPFAVGPNYTRYRGDISSFAGQVEELRLTSLTTPPLNQFNWVLFDSVIFSPVAVPEPGAMALAGLAMTVTVVSCRWRIDSRNGPRHRGRVPHRVALPSSVFKTRRRGGSR